MLVIYALTRVTGDVLFKKVKHGCPLRGYSFIAQYPGSDGSVTIAGGRGQFLCSVYIAGRDKAGASSRKDVGHSRFYLLLRRSISSSK